ncbi:Protein disks lost [Gryllus bimaculatus]|nr:Protein disks lost [Gryllus bimaculatus]
MANKLLNEVISGSISWHDFVYWLTPSHEETQEIRFKVDCNQGDFVIYFVNLLRDEVSSILQKASEVNYTLKKNSSFPTLNAKKKVVYNGRSECLARPPSEHFNNSSKQSINISPGCGSLNKSSLLNNTKTKEDNSVFNKSVDGNNKHFVKCYSLLNGTAKLGTDHLNYANKIKANVVHSVMHKTEKNMESTFLNSCHLSPIAAELYSATKEKYSGRVSEIDSPDHRLIRRDCRSGSGKRVSLERTTSSPSNTSFSIAEHSFPAVGSPAKPNSSRRRRIKPTRLADSFEKGTSLDQNRAPNFGEVVRPLEPSTPFREDVTIKERKESPETDFRDLLRLEKQKLQQNVWNSVVTTTNSQPTMIVNPSPDTVKFKKELSILAKMYNLLLDTNLICNIVTEFHFIFSLLNVQEDVSSSELKESTSLGYFISVHECVFFATTVLNEQRFFLSTLDKASLKQLLNNKRISLFVPDLWQYLSDLHQRRSDSRRFIGSSVFHTSVCFQSDTDNRENFPSDRTFVTFRKQRDAFYEIIGIWEENHSSPGWSFGVALGARVRNLLSMNDEPANFIHFARLFRTQLLGSYWKSSNAAIEEESSSSLSEVLKCLKEGNPDKYSRLYERLVTPVKTSNLGAVSEFPGQQEFYKDFVVHGNHANFNTHLIDSLCNEIEHLNASEFSASDVEEGPVVDKDTKQAFVTCVNNMQLLAKFLGFVLFLPYRSKNKMSSALVEKQISVRRKLRTPIDVLSYVQEAIQSKKLTLTVPWTVQFLSMVDNVSYNLPYYREVISLLCAIYRTLPSVSYHSPYGSFMLKVCLGWLFERPQLPEDIFYTWWIKESQSSELAVNSENSRSIVASIDELDFIEWDTLMILCPNLEAIKWLLMSDSNSGRSVMPPRHITPVLVAGEQTLPSSSRNLELQLEENFLEGQPSSIRKTIEFVSERIASSCVKYICSQPLTEVKQKALKMLEDSDNNDLLSTKLPLETSLLALELKKYCQNVIPKLCFDKCCGVMPLLLAEDVPQEITNICVQIAVRLSLERVNIWINSHITPALFTKHLSSEVDKVNRNSVKTIKSSHVLHGWRKLSEKNALSPAESITIIRNMICVVMGESKVQDDDVLSTLHCILDTLMSRRDLIPSAERVLGSLSVDLAFALVAHHPELIKETILEKFLSIWMTKEVVTSHCFQHLICPRNIMILNKSENGKNVWSAAARFLHFILINNIIPPNEFESQCVAIFRHEWSSETLKHLALCFEEVVEQYQRTNCDANFLLLLELVSDLCREMDNEDF